MNVKNVVKGWNERISKNEESVSLCEQVREVVGMRYLILYFVHLLMQVKNYKQTCVKKKQ